MRIVPTLSMLPKVSDCNSIYFDKSCCTESGLQYIEYSNYLPFIAKRIYYLYNIEPAYKRGNHAHKSLKQCLIPLRGKVEVLLTDGKERKVINLFDPTIGLMIQPLIWKELYFTSKETVCLIIASENYSETDYIRNFDDFLLLRSFDR